MAKKETTIQKVTPNMSVPAFMQRDGKPEGIEQLKEYVVMPRLKVVQKQAGDALLAKYNPGDLILSPTQVMIQPIGERGVKEGQPFLFTPLFFFADWATWNPIELRGQMPAIEYRTANKQDPIVAKSRDRNLRFEDILEGDNKPMVRNGKKLQRRHVEQLNYVVQLHGHDISMPFIMTFAKGEHFSGAKFAGLVRMRNADLFGCVFQGRAAMRSSNGNDWYGIDVENPPADASPWVTEEEYPRFAELYRGFRELYATQGIQADMTDTDDLDANEGSPDLGAAGPREM